MTSDVKLYQPRGGANALFPCRNPEVLIEGPAGTGKTRAVLEKVNRRLLKHAVSRALIVRKTRESMSQSVLVTLEEKVWPDNPDLYPITSDVQRRNRGSYLYPNGSELVVGGLDKPEKIMSTEYDIIAVFEATEANESDWEMLLTRLRNGVMPFQQIIADCNPGPPSHWLNRRADGVRMVRLLSRHEDNPVLHDGGDWTEFGRTYISTLDRLTGARRIRLLSGKWAASEGLVYEAFDSAVHVVPRFPIPYYWRRFRSIDFGFTNPFVCQWWAVDPDGRMYLYREIYKTKTLVEDHAKEIVRLSDGEAIEATVADWDAEDRTTLERHGVSTMPATKSIETGIQEVISRLQDAGDGKRRIYLFPDALVERDEQLVDAKLPTCTREEFDAYLWPKGGGGKTIKELPVDKDNHGMDGMRYGAAYVQENTQEVPNHVSIKAAWNRRVFT